MRAIANRIKHLHRSFLRLLWAWGWAGAVGFVSGLTWLRDEFGSPALSARLKIMSWLPHMSLPWWLCVWLATFWIILFEGSYRRSRELEGERDAALARLRTRLRITLDDETYAQINTEISGRPEGLHTVWGVKVSNDGPGTLSDCQLKITIAEHKTAQALDSKYEHPASDVFSLRAGEHVNLPILGWPFDRREADAFPEAYYLDAKSMRWRFSKNFRRVISPGTFDMRLRCLSADTPAVEILIAGRFDKLADTWVLEEMPSRPTAARLRPLP